MSEGGKRVAISKDQLEEVPEVTHPVGRTHPVTGRKALYVSPGFTIRIEGLPTEEGTALLQELCEYATGPDVVYAHKWRPGDLVFWDNRCTMHCATPFDPSMRRTMYRTTVTGDEIGRAHVCTPVTNAHLVCSLLLDKKT